MPANWNLVESNNFTFVPPLQTVYQAEKLLVQLQISVLVPCWDARYSARKNEYRLLKQGFLFAALQLGIPASFANRNLCIEFVNNLPDWLRSRGM